MDKNFSCGKRIKELRIDRGLSQERLALNAGITPAYLGLLERGKRNATVVIVERICDAMNISLQEFFTAEKKTPEWDDPISRQITCQLLGLSEQEKLAVLHVIKSALQLRQISVQTMNEE